MSKTPITDALLNTTYIGDGTHFVDLARKLETDRAELVALVGRYLSTANIKTLEEALAITEIDDDARALLARLEADK